MHLVLSGKEGYQHPRPKNTHDNSGGTNWNTCTLTLTRRQFSENRVGKELIHLLV